MERGVHPKDTKRRKKWEMERCTFILFADLRLRSLKTSPKDVLLFVSDFLGFKTFGESSSPETSAVSPMEKKEEVSCWIDGEEEKRGQR